MSVTRRKILGRLRVLCTFVLLMGLLMPMARPTPAVAQQDPATPSPTPTPPQVDQGLVRQLSQEGNGQVEIAYHSETGKVRFVGTRPGQPIPRSARVPATASPEDSARAFMATYGPLFGVQNQSRDLAVKRERAEQSGRTVVRFKQQYNGIPIFAGEVIVHLDRSQNVQAATGELLPDIVVNTSPSINPGDARDIALRATARSYNLQPGQLSASEPELWIYNRALVGDPGPQITQLVWRLDVTAGVLDPIRELVLVDAHSGGVALQFNQIPHAKNRLTFTANNDTTLPGTLVCNESNPTCSGGDVDAVAAHTYAGHTYDFYQSRHGRDSIDDAGGSIFSTVHYDVNYQNAFWNGVQMVYGTGFALGDDVVGHELTHGVTEYESGLMYFRQSGAINESFSDIWGELIDLTNESGNDSPAVRWQMGEDIPIGAIRSMADPTAFNHPDRMTSPLYWSSNADRGGVHINSGVNNKAAYLLVDGGSFNGKTVTALGIDKTISIYYEVQRNLLTPGSDHADLYTAMQQACATLTETAVTTAADCQEVLDAIQAVEMHLPPANDAAVQAPMCPAGQSPTDIFFDDLENIASGNWISSAISGSNQWKYPQAPEYTNTTSGTKNIHAFDGAPTSDSVMAKATSVPLPANAYLRFNHSWAFDTDVASGVLRYWDGGILEYSTNNGVSWVNAAPLFTHGGYTGTLRPEPGNPLAGQQAWVGNSDYGSTRVDLASLSGQDFRFRFRLGTDAIFTDLGWFIDDIRIYTCGSGPAAGVTVTPTSGLTTTEDGGTATFTVRLNTTPTSNVTIALESSDPTEGTVTPLSLLFTPLNALAPQTVTVKGIADGTIDSNQPYTIVTGATVSTDPSYSGLAVPDVSVTNINVDTSLCAPQRPRVTMSHTPVAGGRQVTLRAGAGNITTVRFATNTRPIVNARIDYAPVGTNLTTGFTHTLSPPSPTITFTVRRAAAGGQVMVPIVVTDECGPWETFFGSGPHGF